MRLYELHLTLAASIGDPVRYNSSGVTKEDRFVGAVRYSAFNRDSYLKRAMSKIYADALSILARLSKNERANRLSVFFPTSTKLVFGNVFQGQPSPYILIPDLYYAYSLMLKFKYFAPFLRGHVHGPVGVTLDSDGHYIGGVNVPIVDSRELYQKQGRHTVQSNEPLAHVIGYNQAVPSGSNPKGTFIQFVSNNFISDMTAMIVDNGEQAVAYEIAYLATVPDLHSLDTEEYVDFEETYLHEILRYATYFALLDSEDMTQVEVAELLQQNRFHLFEYPDR